MPFPDHGSRSPRLPPPDSLMGGRRLTRTLTEYPDAADRPPSLVGDNVRRALVMGRLYLVISIGYVTLLSVATSFTGGTGFVGAVALF